jgi:hypothetical protein
MTKRNPTIAYTLVEARINDMLKEAEMHRRHSVWLKGQSTSSGPKLSLALVGTLIAAVLVSLVI